MRRRLLGLYRLRSADLNSCCGSSPVCTGSPYTRLHCQKTVGFGHLGTSNSVAFYKDRSPKTDKRPIEIDKQRLSFLIVDLPLGFFCLARQFALCYPQLPPCFVSYLRVNSLSLIVSFPTGSLANAIVNASFPYRSFMLLFVAYLRAHNNAIDYMN